MTSAITSTTTSVSSKRTSQQASGSAPDKLEAEFSRLVDSLASLVQGMASDGAAEQSFGLGELAAAKRKVEQAPVTVLKPDREREPSAAASEKVKSEEHVDYDAGAEEEETDRVSEEPAVEESPEEPSEESEEKVDAQELPASETAVAVAAEATVARALVAEETVAVEGAPVSVEEHEGSYTEQGYKPAQQQPVVEQQTVKATDKAADEAVKAVSDSKPQQVSTVTGAQESFEVAPEFSKANLKNEVEVKVAKQVQEPVVPAGTSVKTDRSVTPLVASTAMAEFLERISGAAKPTLAKPLSLQSSSNATVGEMKATDGAKGGAGSAQARALPRATAQRMMEKVETALRDAARAKDNKSITVRIDPPELGTIRVDVSLREGSLHAKLAPESSQVATFLRDRAHELQGMLRKLGLEVDSVAVSVSSEGFASSVGDTPLGGGDNAGQKFGQGGGTGHFSGGADTASDFVPEQNVTVDHWVA